ncbi:tripartite tricarboxylate transporter substrate binding protein [Halomonas sediminis]
MKRNLLTLTVAIASLGLAGLSSVQAAEDYPAKDIKLVIPFGPGGATDIIFRLVSQEAEKSFDQSIVPVNMQGAGATRGSREVKNADPDGYTLLGSHDTIALSKLAGMADYSYGAFEPIALLTQTVNIPTTYAGHQAQNAENIAEYVKENKGDVRIGMIPSSTDHFFWVQFLEEAGIPLEDVRMVGYPDTGSQVSALLAEEIDFTMLNMPSGGSFFEEGSFHPLGVAYEKRLDALPDTPTLQEQGIDLVNATSRGLFAPKGTSEEHIQIIADAYQKALENETVASRIENEFGSVVNYKSPDEYQQFLSANEAALTKVAENIDFSK